MSITTPVDFLELQTRAREILEDTGTNLQWSDVILKRYLNDAAQDFAIRTKCIRKYSGALSASTTFDATKPYAFYALPTDIHELESVWVNGYHVPQARVSRLPYQWDIETCSSAAEPTAYIYGDFGLSVLRFWPYPIDAAYTTAKVYYTALPTLMVSNTDKPTGIPDRYMVALVYYAIAMCYRRNFEDNDRRKGEEFMGLYLDQIRDCQGRIERLLNAEGIGVPYRHL